MRLLRTTTRLLFGLTLLGVLAACEDRSTEPTPVAPSKAPTTAAPEPSSALEPPSGFTNEQRIAVMLSIHAHAYWPDGNFPAGIRAHLLHDAVNFLMEDPDRLAIS